jgi:sec-independent protein translocase protein TatA
MHPWGLGEILLIFVIILVFWGPSRLGGVGKGLGEGIRNFKKGLRHDPPPAAPPAPSAPLAPPPGSDTNRR